MERDRPELQFNLNVMVCLQEVLLTIADDEDSRKEIWGDLPGHGRPQMAGDAVLDVIEMALKACDRLPHFASNLDDWKSYTEYVMTNSPSLRNRAISNPTWWPEVTPYALKTQTLLRLGPSHRGPHFAHSVTILLSGIDRIVGPESVQSGRVVLL